MFDYQQYKTMRTVNEILQETLLPEHALDPKVWNFIISYIETVHVADAAKASKLTKAQGLRILSKPDVQLALREVYAGMSRANSFDAKELLERTNEIAQVNPLDVLEPNGVVKDHKDIPPNVARTIKKIIVEETWEKDINGIETKTGRIVKIEFWDKLKATELLGKYEGVFKDKVEHTHEIGGNLAGVLLAQAESRALEAARPVIAIEDKKDE